MAALGGTPTAALAADNCPNAKVRAQQFRGAELPNCFAWEKITPNDKNGSEVAPDSAVLHDGSVVSVWSQVHLFGSDDSGSQNLGIATRGADGWKIRMQTNTPLWGQRRPADLNDVGWGLRWSTSRDLQSLLFRTQHPIDSGDLGNAGGSYMTTPDLYLSQPDGSMVWVSAPVSGSYPAGVAVVGSAAPEALGASPDLDRVIFATNRIQDPDVDATSRHHRWLWRPGHRLEAIDRLPDGSLSTGTVATTSIGMVSDDARTMVFTSSSLHGRTHVYARVGIGTPDERTILVSANAAGAPCDATLSFRSLTVDGRYVRFGCSAQLTADAPSNGGSYVRDTQTGAVIYDDPQVDRGPLANASLTAGWTRPEGTYSLRERREADPIPAGVAHNHPLWRHQLMRIDHTTGDIVCVSCPADDSEPTDGMPAKAGRANGASGGRGLTMEGMVTPAGEVVFATATRLVPEDTNNHRDVYMWKDGKHYLLTSGVASTHATFGGVSLDGSTITLGTGTAMVPEDRDGGEVDIYALRKNGGFYRAPEPVPCSSDCQGPAVPVNPLVVPLSLSFPASGDVVSGDGEDADPVRVSGSRSVRGTSLKIKVRTPGAGRVRVSGNGLRKSSKSAKSALTVTVTVKLSARSKRLLRKRSSVKRRATVRFVPVEGKSQSKRVTVTFRKAKKKSSSRSKKKGSSRSVAAVSNGKAAR